MEVTGLITAIKPKMNGVSMSGKEWVRQDFVLDYFWWPNQQQPTQVCFSAFGEDKAKQLENLFGKEVTVRFHIEMREYQGRFFNDVRFDGFRFPQPQGKGNEGTGQGTTQGTSQSGEGTQTTPEMNANGQQAAASFEAHQGEDDLPF